MYTTTHFHRVLAKFPLLDARNHFAIDMFIVWDFDKQFQHGSFMCTAPSGRNAHGRIASLLLGRDDNYRVLVQCFFLCRESTDSVMRTLSLYSAFSH
jgi:hypothetical protein